MMRWSCWIGSTASNCAVIAALTLGMLVLAAGGCHADELDRKFHNWEARKFHDIERQRTDFTCGAASLAIISQQYWGKPIKEAQFTIAIHKSHTDEEWKDIQKNGLSMLDLKRAAAKFGLSAEGLKMNIAQLRKVKGPILIHLDKGFIQHFSVFKGFQGDRAYLADPISGNSRVPLYRFEEEWTGYALAVWVEGQPLPAVNKLAPDPGDVPGEMTAYRGALYSRPDLTFYPFNF